MSNKRKASRLSRDNNLSLLSSPLASAYGIEDVLESQPESSRLSSVGVSMRHAAAGNVSNTRNNALDEATRALKQATSNLKTTTAIPGDLEPTNTVVDARCITCQNRGYQCQCQKPVCNGCANSNARCQYYRPEDSSLRCLRCPELSNPCDLKRLTCSNCALYGQRCMYPAKFLSKWCESCRQPDRNCDMRRPECSECKSRNQLCKYDGAATTYSTEVEVIDLGSDGEDDTELEYEVEKILQVRSMHGKTEYLVRWKGYREEDDTWEPAANVQGADEAIKEFYAGMNSARPQVSKSNGYRVDSIWQHNTSHALVPVVTSSRNPVPVHGDNAEVIQFRALKARIAEDANSQIAVHPSAYNIQPKLMRTSAVRSGDMVRQRTANDIEHIITYRKNSQGHEYLVRWKGGNEFSDSWVDWQFIQGAKDAIREYKRMLEERRPAGHAVTERQPRNPHRPAESFAAESINLILNRRWQADKVQYLVQWNRPGYPSSLADEKDLKGAEEHVARYKASVARLAKAGHVQFSTVTSFHHPPILYDTESAGPKARHEIQTSRRARDVPTPNQKNSTSSAASLSHPNTGRSLIETLTDQPRRGGRPRKDPSRYEPIPKINGWPARDAVEVLNLEDNKDASASISEQSSTLPPPAKYIVWPRKQQHPDPDKLPIADGLYDKYTVATHFLRAIGKHPWLPELNVRLAGLLDEDTNGKRLDAQQQDSRGSQIQEMMAKREAELGQRGR